MQNENSIKESLEFRSTDGSRHQFSLTFGSVGGTTDDLIAGTTKADSLSGAAGNDFLFGASFLTSEIFVTEPDLEVWVIRCTSDESHSAS